MSEFIIIGSVFVGVMIVFMLPMVFADFVKVAKSDKKPPAPKAEGVRKFDYRKRR